MENKMKTCLAWIRCLQQNSSPFENLKAREISEIIIYGISDLGELLLSEAIIKEYNVRAITDARIKEGDYMYRDVPVITCQDLLLPQYENVHIVVTAMAFYEEIKNELNEKGIDKVISLLELLN